MKKLKEYLLSISLIVIVSLIFIIDVFNEDKIFSNYENRSLALKPDFYYSNFISGRYFKNYERYINDQFLFRNIWINIKSASEFILGKKENNGIIYGDNNYLFDKFDSIDGYNLNKNINTLKDFILDSNLKFNIMIIPESFSIYKELLPLGINLVDEIEYIKNIDKEFSNIKNCKSINLIDTLVNNKDNYIYYKTDHHWTSFGAYLAYKEFAYMNNIKPIEINNLNENIVNGFRGTYFSKSKNFNVEDDYIVYYDTPNIEVEIDGTVVDGLNDESKWSSSDKYSAFLRGNNGVTIIKNTLVKDKSKILVIKDSYANSFIQFLINNYAEVLVVDLRSFVGSFNEFYKINNFDEVLVLYSFKNLVNDVDISRIKY